MSRRVEAHTATVTKRYEWDMGHRLPEHKGKCKKLHGHHYVAEIDVTGPVFESGPSAGMVVDFYELKSKIVALIGHWDHMTMLHEDDPLMTTWNTGDGGFVVFNGQGSDRTPVALNADIQFGIFRVPFVPTAENIAQHIFRLLVGHFNVTRVRVYETPTGWAEVTP